MLAATAISATGDDAFVSASALLAAEFATLSPYLGSGQRLPDTWIMFGIPADLLFSQLPARRVLIAANPVRVGLMAVLAALTALGYVSLAPTVVTIVLAGATQTFSDPAGQAIISAIVGRAAASAACNGPRSAAATGMRLAAGAAYARATPPLIDEGWSS